MPTKKFDELKKRGDCNCPCHTSPGAGVIHAGGPCCVLSGMLDPEIGMRSRQWNYDHWENEGGSVREELDTSS